jgi:hypothetical protein
MTDVFRSRLLVQRQRRRRDRWLLAVVRRPLFIKHTMTASSVMSADGVPPEHEIHGHRMTARPTYHPDAVRPRHRTQRNRFPTASDLVAAAAAGTELGCCLRRQRVGAVAADDRRRRNLVVVDDVQVNTATVGRPRQQPRLSTDDVPASVGCPVKLTGGTVVPTNAVPVKIRARNLS